MRVLWVTNDLPPRAGGIEQFVASLIERVHPDDTVVVGPPAGVDAVAHDPSQPYRIVRAPGSVLPNPRTLRLVVDIARSHRPDVVVLGAAWPLGELAGPIKRRLGLPVVALSHGLEAGLARARLGPLVSRATRDLDALTAITSWTERLLEPHVRAVRFERLPPGVDVDRFTPDVDGSDQRASWGIPSDATVVGCVSRLVPRKGQDLLLDVWPRLRERHPDAWLALVGEGPSGDALGDRVRRMGAKTNVVLPGRVPWHDLPSSYAALDLFAMPCRTRFAGLDVEGLGIVYLEAQACGVPVIAGGSGGAPEAVRDGVTGSVVDGRDADALLDVLDHWLGDPAARAAAGSAGRAWAERWSWEAIAASFAGLLDQVVSGDELTRRPS